MTATATSAAATTCHVLDSDFGPVSVEFSDTAVTRIHFGLTDEPFGPEPPARGDLLPWQREALDALRAYLDGERVDLSEIPVDLSEQPPFRRRVQEECRRIPHGETVTYAELARRAGNPAAVRAAGSAMRHNQIALLVPCHRVVRSDGGIGGFSAPQGIGLKEQLLAMERQ
jgi:methylated-DNA-[protein]-cysteine S-methyltransferase